MIGVINLPTAIAFILISIILTIILIANKSIRTSKKGDPNFRTKVLLCTLATIFGLIGIVMLIILLLNK